MVRRSRVRGDFRRLRRRGKRVRSRRAVRRDERVHRRGNHHLRFRNRTLGCRLRRERERGAELHGVIHARGVDEVPEVLVVDARGDGSERSRRRSFAAAAEERVRRRRFGSVGRGFRVRSRPFREHRDARPEMRGRSRRGEASKRRDLHRRGTAFRAPLQTDDRLSSRRFLAARFFLRPGRRDVGERRRVGEHHGHGDRTLQQHHVGGRGDVHRERVHRSRDRRLEETRAGEQRASHDAVIPRVFVRARVERREYPPLVRSRRGRERAKGRVRRW